MFEHSETCKRLFSDYEKQVQDWEEKYPNFCRVCMGVGSLYQPGDWVPYGSTSAQLPGWDESCGECVEQGKCSRCRVQLVNPEEYDFENPLVCFQCGWHENPNPGDRTEENLVHPSVYHHPTGWGHVIVRWL